MQQIGMIYSGTPLINMQQIGMCNKFSGIASVQIVVGVGAINRISLQIKSLWTLEKLAIRN